MLKNRKGRRKIAAENVALQNRLNERQTLLAAIALEYGTDGRLMVSRASFEDVAGLMDERTIALRLFDTGDACVDFRDPRPELEIVSVEEPAACQ